MIDMDILIVDDDQAIRNLYDAIFSVLPYSFKVVSSGEKAVELMNEYKFKIFVLDINLGTNIMNGVDLSLYIKSKHEDAIIYALTGYSKIFDGIDPSVAGFDRVFNKGLDYKELVFKIKEDLTNMENT